MSKTDKELAVEITCACIGAWAACSDGMDPLDEEIVTRMLKAAYNAVCSLPNEKSLSD